jgi:hypothetical protein
MMWRVEKHRGFLLIAVLVLLTITVLMSAWILQRVTTQALVGERRIRGYVEHHELLGVRALALHWISRQDVRGELAELAKRGEVGYRAELPNDTVVTMSVADGQGAILSRVEDMPTAEIRGRIVRALRRLPPDRPELTRGMGPLKVSVRAASDEVLEALAGDDDVVARVLAEARRAVDEDDGDLVRRLNTAGLDQQQSQEIMALVTMSPTLWRLDVEVRDDVGSRRYEVLALTEGNIPFVLDSRPSVRGERDQ